jgi:hypothetical protein
MNYEEWYKNLSPKDKSQEKRNLETILEEENFSKVAKQIAKIKLSRTKM